MLALEKPVIAAKMYPRPARIGSWIAACACLAAVVFPDRAGAQQDRPEAPPEAIEYYSSGREHYEAGRYREAIVDLKAALELDPESPNLVYNVARVSELLGDLNEAITYYERYLELLPGSETRERERIRATVRRLEGARDEVVSRAAEDGIGLKAPSTPAPSPALGRADALFWITGSVGVALLATGAAMGMLALDRQDQVGAFVLGPDGTLQDRDNLISEAETFAIVADTAVGVGAGVVISAALLYFLREPDVEEEPVDEFLELSFDRRGASLTLRGTL